MDMLAVWVEPWCLLGSRSSTSEFQEERRSLVSVFFLILVHSVRFAKTRHNMSHHLTMSTPDPFFGPSCLSPKSTYTAFRFPTVHRAMHDASIPATSQEFILSTFRDTDGLPLPVLPPRSATSSDAGMAEPSQSRKSSRDVARRAAKGDVGARLECWSIHDVERSLEKIQLPDSEISLLSCLRSPNVNKAEAVKEILEIM